METVAALPGLPSNYDRNDRSQLISPLAIATPHSIHSSIHHLSLREHEQDQGS
jgi:hypothetical protein